MNLEDNKWLYRHLKLAEEISGWSKDQSTKVGALIVTPEGKPVSWGYNGIPMGVNESDSNGSLNRNYAPTKYHYYAHAERDALDLSRSSVQDCWLFTTHPPCSDCARGIIQTGISTVVVNVKGLHDFLSRRSSDWCESAFHSVTMFGEAGVGVVYFDMIKGIRVEPEAITITKEQVCL